MNARRWLLLGTTLLALAGLFTWRAIEWWTFEPWDKLEHIASTFPVPDGFERLDSRRIGDRPAVCDIKPSCQDPQIMVRYRRTKGTLSACAGLQESAREWAHLGFSQSKADGGYADGDFPGVAPGCIADGEIDGHSVQVYSIDGAQEQIMLHIGYNS